MQNINPDIFRQMAALSRDVYFIFNAAAHRFEYISPAFETIWAMPAENVRHNPQCLLDTIHPEDRTYVLDCYKHIGESKQEGRFNFRLAKPSQKDTYIHLKLYPLPADEQPGLFAGIAEDVTALQNNILYAEKINARKNSMLVVLAHDLRGPIGIVNMMASSLQNKLKAAGDENMLQSVKVIQDLCKRNIELIRNLIDQEFLESPEVGLRKERVDLVWHVNDFVTNYKRSADVLSKKIIFTSSHEKLYIQMDTLKMMQVVNNLISNAIKFTQDEGEITVDIQDRHPMVQISVRDNGIGIPAELQPYLFDKFTRARRPGLNGEDAVGLGMSIIKTIVELHKGRIWLESKEHEGSAFYIEIPKQ